MSFTIVQREEENNHVWTAAMATCQLDNADDLLVQTTVALVRQSYGETEILADAVDLMATEIDEGLFSTEHLIAAIRMGLPNPGSEGNKPPALTTYRSQTAEMVAKAALREVYNFEYPAAPQEGTPNPNQPILGFDGWGLLQRSETDYTLVLIQVKATDEQACPPAVAEHLAEECRRILQDTNAIARGLSVLVRLLRGNPLETVVLRMLATIGSNQLPDIHIAPAIIRGTSNCHIDDLQPVRKVSANFAPATFRGIVVNIGVSLSDFGETVMRKAREAA